jgi:hypothetical protein
MLSLQRTNYSSFLGEAAFRSSSLTLLIGEKGLRLYRAGV